MHCSTRARRAFGALAATLLAGAGFAAQASAHAHVSPSIVQKGQSETYTLVVPSEGTADTTAVELTVPAGFQIGSFEAAPGWKRDVVATGEGDEAVVSKVTWTGGQVREPEAAYLRFQGSSEKSGDFAFKVRQTYSDGKVEEWTGPESSDSPAPVVEVKDSLGGGGGGGDTTGVIAVIVAGLAFLLALAAILARGGRSLT